MTGQAMARLNGVTADVGPAPGSAWQPARPGVPPPLHAGRFTLVTMPTSPFWARRYTRTFLGSCRGISQDTAQTAELLVSELVTNAVRFAGIPRARRGTPSAPAPAWYRCPCGISASTCSLRSTTATTPRRPCPTPATTPKAAGA